MMHSGFRIFRCRPHRLLRLLVNSAYLFAILCLIFFINSRSFSNNLQQIPNNNNFDNRKAVIGVLVLFCDRATVTRTLDQLVKYRPSPKTFPIVVSQDCGLRGNKIKKMLRAKYDRKVTAFISHPYYYDVTQAKANMTEPHMMGYFHIAAHYGWALDYTFNKLGYDNVIVVEDDLDISPDFFEYFQATLRLLYEDPTLMCISAYNDNGKEGLIDMDAPSLLYRTDFFPGLGWMLTKELWDELSVKWPEKFWDDWIRHSEQRKNRSCIHPEISRSKTYGRHGVSNGQFFDQHLKTIKLNKRFVPFKIKDLSYLLKEKYDEKYFKLVQDAEEVSSLTYIERDNTKSETDEDISYRITYSSQDEFNQSAFQIGMMTDFKYGIPRGGYNGVVPVMFRGRRLYFVPE